MYTTCTRRMGEPAQKHGAGTGSSSSEMEESEEWRERGEGPERRRAAKVGAGDGAGCQERAGGRAGYAGGSGPADVLERGEAV